MTCAKGAVLTVCLLLFPMIVVAQSSEAISLARLCVSEAGWEPGPDCDAIYEVIYLRSRMRHTSFDMTARAYGRSAYDRHRTDSRAWIAFLNRNYTEPSFWPSNLPWARYRVLWRTMVARARELLLGTRKSWCGAEHWGAPGGNARIAHRSGWTRVSCGSTTNVFWRE